MHVQEGASITIQDYDGTGSLNAKASSAGAIGASADGSYGNITILSGEIIAHSGGGAGIGGGMYEASSHGDITIVSGTVTAMSVEGRGIGHGADTNDAYNTILIKGGTVTAEGDKGGILGKIINIEGGNVTATGREYGINADDLVVSGDTVTAIGGDEGTGIECDNSLDISGGTVTATGGDSGINGDESINISGGTVTATGGDGWAFGINCRTLTIRGAETTITAIAGDTGINVRTFDITKGTVKATGGESGIDGYYINIHGGTVTATGDDAGIEASDHIQIYGGTVTATGSESGLLSDHIAISGGTVTATGDDVGINCGYMFITGGSVKTKEPEILNVDNINENSYDSETGMLNDSDCPTDEEDEDGNSATVWLAIFPATSNGEIITVDDTTTYTLGDLHEGDNHWYLYLTGETHDVKIGKTNYSVTFMATETNDVLYAETGYPSAETGYFAVTEEPSISIEDKVITSGTVGAAYPKDGETSALKATLENLPPEAEATWKWEMTSGNLPDGLTFSSETTDTITITGEPKAEDEQTVTFTVTATLTDGTVLSATQTVTITIGDKLPILDIEGSVVDGKVGKDYPEQQLKVTADVEGELTDVTWTDNGKLPPGLTLNKDGVISGTPTKSGTYTFEVTVVATVNDEEVTTTEEFTIKIESSGGGGGSSKPKPEKEKEPEKEPELVVPNDLNGEDHFAYVVGYPDGTVRPNANITRAEVASIFFRLLNDDVRGTNWTYANDFSDVAESAWYCAPVSTLSDLNIIHGRDNNSFDPSANITRAEFAAIAARFASNDYTRTASFTDISGHWSESNIIKAASHGWIVGDGDGTFRPDDAITRAEAMTLINRVLVRLPEYSSDLLDDMTIWPDNSNVSAWYYLAVQEATNSHNYDMKDSNYESWTSLRADRDWSIYQK